MTIESSSFFIDQKIRVKPATNEIYRGQKSVMLQPRIMRLLQLLCEQPGEVIAKEDLISQLWGHGTIYEESLTKAVSILRQNLGDKRLIKTVPKIGYCFTGSVSSVEIESKQRRIPAFYAWVLVVCVVAGFIIAGNNRTTKEKYTTDYAQQYITTDRALYLNPTISESGDLVAYVRRDQSGMPFNMVVKNLALDRIVYQSNNEQISYDSPTISPDDQYVGFVSSYCKKKTVSSLDLHAGEMKDLYLLNAKSKYMALDWSANNQIVFTDWNDATHSHDLFILNTQDQKAIDITSSKYDEFEPEFSPDASMLAYIRGWDGNYELCIQDLRRKSVAVLLESDNPIFDVTWKSQNELLVSKKGWNGEEVFLYDIDEMEKEVLSHANFSCVSSAKNSNTFVAGNYRRNDNIWLKPLDSNDDSLPRQILFSNRKEHKGMISPDNHNIAFVSDLSTTPQIWIYNLNDDEANQLTQFENNHRFEKIDWSPDSKQLAVKFTNSESSGVFLVELESRQGKVILDQEQAKYPQFSKDGEGIYFIGEKSGELWRYDFERGSSSKVISVPVKDISYYQFNAQEDQFYYITEREGQIKKYDLKTGATDTLIGKIDSRDLDSWALAESGIYYIKRNKTEGNVTFYDFTKKSESLIEPLPHNNYCYNTKLSVSNNEKFIIYNTISHFESDVVLVKKMDKD